MNMTQSFLNVALATGTQWVIICLLFLSVVNVAIILERILYFRKYSGNFPDFVQKLGDAFAHKESLEKVGAWCSGQQLLEARVAAMGLERGALGPRPAEESMNAMMIATKNRMEQGLVVLATLGNNTPFLGLFGTIIGIIQAFHALSGTGLPQSEEIMGAIAEALVATALGILVALPAVVAYNFFNRGIKKKMANTEATAHMVLTHLESNPYG